MEESTLSTRNNKLADPTYKRAVIKHSKKRAEERYKIETDSDAVFILNTFIKRELKEFNPDPSKVLILYRESKFSSMFHLLVHWKEKYMWVVWNNDLATIQTFLSIDRLSEKLNRFSNSVIGYLTSKNLIKVKAALILKLRGRPVNVLSGRTSHV